MADFASHHMAEFRRKHWVHIPACSVDATFIRYGLIPPHVGESVGELLEWNMAGVIIHQRYGGVYDQQGVYSRLRLSVFSIVCGVTPRMRQARSRMTGKPDMATTAPP